MNPFLSDSDEDEDEVSATDERRAGLRLGAGGGLDPGSADSLGKHLGQTPPLKSLFSDPSQEAPTPRPAPRSATAPAPPTTGTQRRSCLWLCTVSPEEDTFRKQILLWK